MSSFGSGGAKAKLVDEDVFESKTRIKVKNKVIRLYLMEEEEKKLN